MRDEIMVIISNLKMVRSSLSQQEDIQVMIAKNNVELRGTDKTITEAEYTLRSIES